MANPMENMILKRRVGLSLAANGNTILASSPGWNIPVPNNDSGGKEEEEIKGKLGAMLTDPSKQGRIEVRIVKKLKQINGSEKFDNVFAAALSACEETRKNPVYHNKAITADEHDPNFLRILSRKCTTIAWQCREMLYNLEAKQITLNVIQKLVNLENEYGPQYREFFRFNQIFYYSRSLLAVTIAPQIIKQYIDDNMGEETAFQIIAFEEIKDGDGPANHICRFTIDEDEYICEFLRKPVGLFFGSIVTIKASDGRLLKRYYLKAHEGYPAINVKNSKESYADTSTQGTSPNRSTANRAKLDLREPFVYKALEQLGYGPKVHFFVNPYINYGLYIVTEDLNSELNVFKELKDIKANVENANMVFDIDSQSKIKRTVESGLNELSVLTSIFQLKDIKGDNIGFVGTEEIWEKLLHEEDSDEEEEEEYQFLQPIIIDFLNDLTYESSTINRDAQRYILSQSLIDGEMFRSYSANAPFSRLIMPHEKLYTEIYNAKEDTKPFSSRNAEVYIYIAQNLKQATDKFLPKKQDAWCILSTITEGKEAFNKLLLEIKDFVISAAEKVLQPINAISTLQQRMQQLNTYCSLLETNYDVAEELLTASESNAELCKLASEVNEMCESVQKKAEEQISKAKAKSESIPKNTGIPKKHIGTSAGLKHFIAEERLKIRCIYNQVPESKSVLYI